MESSQELPPLSIEVLSNGHVDGNEIKEANISIEGSTEIPNRFGISLGMKKFIYLSGCFIIIALGTILFFKVNYYEMDHNCHITMNVGFHFPDSLSPIICEINPPRPMPRSMTSCPSNIDSRYNASCLFKPLILLYPEKKQEIQVELEYAPGFSATFPEYDSSKRGWSVTASPDGTLLDHSTMMETYGLFWEGNGVNTHYNITKGWVVAGKDLRNFLYEKLTEIGLSTKEKSDFIMFWYPKLQDYPYIQITFAGDDYAASAPLNITPKPDSLLRVFMVAKPLDTPIAIEPQKLERFERKGLSVVEWGGTIVE